MNIVTFAPESPPRPPSRLERLIMGRRTKTFWRNVGLAIAVMGVLAAVQLGVVKYRVAAYGRKIDSCVAGKGVQKPTQHVDINVNTILNPGVIDEVGYAMAVLACDDDLGGAPGYWSLP